MELLDGVLDGGNPVLHIFMASTVDKLSILVGGEERSGEFPEVGLEGTGYTRDVWLALRIGQGITS